MFNNRSMFTKEKAKEFILEEIEARGSFSFACYDWEPVIKEALSEMIKDKIIQVTNLQRYTKAERE